MEGKNLIRSVITVIGRSGLFNRAAARRGIRLAPLLLVAVMLAAVAVLAETSNPAQTVHAHEGDDHRHVDCPYSCTYDNVPGGDAEVWSATLTVGGPTNTLTDYRGYFPLGGFSFGSLSPATFTLGGDTSTVAEVRIASDGLFFVLDKQLPRDFTISLDGRSFSSTNATQTQITRGTKYTWSPPPGSPGR